MLQADPPLALRASEDAIYLVSAAAFPIGGDDVTLTVDVAPGSAATIRSAAASVALPGNDGAGSSFAVHARVGVGACLHWRPEPLVVAAACCHRSVAHIEIEAGAVLRWREELVLGRTAEAPGACTTRLHVDRGGAPLVRHDMVIDEYARSLGVLGSARAIGTLLVVGDTPRPIAATGVEAEMFALAEDAALVVALGADVAAVRAAIAGADGSEADARR